MQHRIVIKCEDPLQRKDNFVTKNQKSSSELTEESETKLDNNGTCIDVYHFHNYAQIETRKIDPYSNSEKNREQQNDHDDGVDDTEEEKTHQHTKNTPLKTSILIYNTWDDISVAEQIEVSTTLHESHSIDTEKYEAPNNSKKTVEKTSVKLKEQTDSICSNNFIVRAAKRRKRNDSINVKTDSASIKKKRKITSMITNYFSNTGSKSSSSKDKIYATQAVDKAFKIKPRRQLFASTSIDENIDFQSHTEHNNDSKIQ